MPTQEFEIGPSGIKIKIAEIQGKQASLQKDINALRFLVSGFVTEWEHTHLQKLMAKGEFDYVWGGDRNDRFIQELIRLWDFGLISRKNTKSWYDIPLKGDLRPYAAITERGKQYLLLRSQVLARSISTGVDEGESPKPFENT